MAVPQNLTLRAELGSGSGHWQWHLLLSPVHSVNPTTRHRQITIPFRWTPFPPLIAIFIHIRFHAFTNLGTADGNLLLLQHASIFSSAVFSFSGRFLFQSAWNSIHGGEHMGSSRMRFGHVKSRLYKYLIPGCPQCKPVSCEAHAAGVILS